MRIQINMKPKLDKKPREWLCKDVHGNLVGTIEKSAYDKLFAVVEIYQEALEYNKSQWETITDGHKHMVAWQITRDALAKAETLMGGTN